MVGLFDDYIIYDIQYIQEAIKDVTVIRRFDLPEIVPWGIGIILVWLEIWLLDLFLMPMLLTGAAVFFVYRIIVNRSHYVVDEQHLSYMINPLYQSVRTDEISELMRSNPLDLSVVVFADRWECYFIRYRDETEQTLASLQYGWL